MLINAQRLVDKVRFYVQDTAAQQQGNQWTDADVVACLNEEQEGLIAKVIEASEDYFLVVKDMALQANVNSYPLFDGFLLLRKLEAAPVTPGDAGDVTDVIESRLIEGIQGAGGIASSSESQYYYALRDENVDIQPTPGTSIPSMRQWFIREPGPMLLENPSSVPDASNLVFSSQDAPPEDDIMVGTRLDVVSGSGVGQRRQISVYAGATKTATVSSPFSPAPTTASKIATISRVPRLFQTLLAYGAGIRLQASVKESTAHLTSLYNDRMEDFEDYVERARTYAQRGVQPFDADDGI